MKTSICGSIMLLAPVVLALVTPEQGHAYARHGLDDPPRIASLEEPGADFVVLAKARPAPKMSLNVSRSGQLRQSGVHPFNGASGAPTRTRVMPSTITTPSGQKIKVPTGAVGPTPTRSDRGRGNLNGGLTLSNGKDRLRVMPPRTGYPNGLYKYERFDGRGWQAINRKTGETVGKNNPAAHIPLRGNK